MENADRRKALPAPCDFAIFRRRRVCSLRSSRLAVFVVVGLAVTLFGDASALAKNPLSSELKSTNRVQASAPVHRPHVTSDEDVPLIFLAIIGLGALTLAHTRPTPPRSVPAGSFCAGKNEPGGKDLPESAAATGLAR